jgi:hypothetical protein
MKFGAREPRSPVDEFARLSAWDELKALGEPGAPEVYEEFSKLVHEEVPKVPSVDCSLLVFSCTYNYRNYWFI